MFYQEALPKCFYYMSITCLSKIDTCKTLNQHLIFVYTEMGGLLTLLWVLVNRTMLLLKSKSVSKFMGAVLYELPFYTLHLLILALFCISPAADDLVSGNLRLLNAIAMFLPFWNDDTETFVLKCVHKGWVPLHTLVGCNCSRQTKFKMLDLHNQVYHLNTWHNTHSKKLINIVRLLEPTLRNPVNIKSSASLLICMVIVYSGVLRHGWITKVGVIHNFISAWHVIQI